MDSRIRTAVARARAAKAETTLRSTSMAFITKIAHAIYKEFFQFKNRKFSSEKNDIFLIFAQNIDC